MRQIVPFSKDIIFKTKIAEITSISLEHEYSINEGAVEGNFIISGDYKVHEVSVNKEKFIYRLPFSVELTNNIELDSINFEICDFTYDVVGEDDLRIDIEFAIEAKEKEVVENEPVQETIPEISEPEIPIFSQSEDIINLDNDNDERIEPTTKETIISNIGQTDDTYITYHVHIVRENETLESICAKYQANIENIKQYNSIEEINLGDKLIIPDVSYE